MLVAVLFAVLISSGVTFIITHASSTPCVCKVGPLQKEIKDKQAKIEALEKEIELSKNATITIAKDRKGPKVNS